MAGSDATIDEGGIPQLKPLLRMGGGSLKPLVKGAEVGLGASQAMQWSASGLLSMVHVEQVQVPSGLVGSLSPAAAQLKATGVALTGAGAGMSAGIVGDVGVGAEVGAEVGADAAALGLGASHTEHLLSVSFVLQLQTVQVHSPATGVLGFNPAAAQSKGIGLTGAGTAEGAGAGLGAGAGVVRVAVAGASRFGASQTEHLVAVFSDLRPHPLHPPAPGRAGLRLAAAQLRVATACITGAERTGGTVFFLSIQGVGSNIGLRSITNAGSSSWGAARAIACALGSPITTS